MGIVAASEELVEDNLLEPLSAAGNEDVDTPSLLVKISVTKAWSSARQTMKNDSARAQQGSDEMPIPIDDEKDLKNSWKSRHSFVLSNGRLLIAPLQGRLWRGVTARPNQRIDIYLAEQLRTMGCTDKKQAQALLIPTSGGIVRSQESSWSV